MYADTHPQGSRSATWRQTGMGPLGTGVLLLSLALFAARAAAIDIFQGKSVYESYCVSCHGPDGRGLVANAPNFRRGQGLMQSDRALYQTIRSGGATMPGYRGVLSEQDIFDVIGYLRTFH